MKFASWVLLTAPPRTYLHCLPKQWKGEYSLARLTDHTYAIQSTEYISGKQGGYVGRARKTCRPRASKSNALHSNVYEKKAFAIPNLILLKLVTVFCFCSLLQDMSTGVGMCPPSWGKTAPYNGAIPSYNWTVSCSVGITCCCSF